MPKSPLLKVEKVSKHFRGLLAVDTVSLSVKHGQIVGLIGPNGAGKTTLFQMISGFIPCDCGHIFFEGSAIEQNQPFVIARKGITRTFQITKPLNDLTVLENVMLGSLVKGNAPHLALQHAKDLLDILELRSKGTLVSNELSLLDCKRLELARALATKPKLLLLDEVMAGLRPGEMEEIIKALKTLKQTMGLTILMVEHSIQAIVALCDHTVVLNAGQKIAEGSPQQILKNPDVINVYWGKREPDA